jgi:hypothetical protein
MEIFYNMLAKTLVLLMEIFFIGLLVKRLFHALPTHKHVLLLLLLLLGGRPMNQQSNVATKKISITNNTLHNSSSFD